MHRAAPALPATSRRLAFVKGAKDAMARTETVDDYSVYDPLAEVRGGGGCAARRGAEHVAAEARCSSTAGQGQV